MLRVFMLPAYLRTGSLSHVRTQDAAAMCTHREAFPGLLRAGGMAMFACRGHSNACGQDAADETIDGGI